MNQKEPIKWQIHKWCSTCQSVGATFNNSKGNSHHVLYFYFLQNMRLVTTASTRPITAERAVEIAAETHDRYCGVPIERPQIEIETAA